MSTYVLIPGAWHGSWCWEHVAPLLEAAGHQVHALDLPGTGTDRTPLSGVTLEFWSQWIAVYLEALGEPAILVGHSRGGILVSRASELVPDRVEGLVYLAAFMLRDGESMQSTYRNDDSEAAAWAPRVAADGSSTLPPEVALAALYQRTPDAIAEAAIARLVAEPMAVHGEKLAVSAAHHGRIPRAYIETRYDRIFPLALQRDMQTRWTCKQVIALDSDHSPFCSAPRALADALAGLAFAR
jgi:pimeloyl-ACP methyl ester carboxylesterase